LSSLQQQWVKWPTDIVTFDVFINIPFKMYMFVFNYVKWNLERIIDTLAVAVYVHLVVPTGIRHVRCVTRLVWICGIVWSNERDCNSNKEWEFKEFLLKYEYLTFIWGRSSFGNKMRLPWMRILWCHNKSIFFYLITFVL